MLKIFTFTYWHSPSGWYNSFLTFCKMFGDICRISWLMCFLSSSRFTFISNSYFHINYFSKSILHTFCLLLIYNINSYIYYLLCYITTNFHMSLHYRIIPRIYLIFFIDSIFYNWFFFNIFYLIINVWLPKI